MNIQQPKFAIGDSCYFINVNSDQRDGILSITTGYSFIIEIYVSPFQKICSYSFFGRQGNNIQENRVFKTFEEFTYSLKILLEQYNQEQENNFKSYKEHGYEELQQFHNNKRG